MVSGAARIAWIFMVTWAACASAPPAAPSSARETTPDDPDVAPTPTQRDAEVLRHADELLSDASRWNHFGDRNCQPNARSWNLYCVIRRASSDVTGTFQHRSAAMQEVRWVVEERTRGRDLEHRLMDYNNLPETTFAEIKAVLGEARRRLERKLTPAPVHSAR